MIPDVSERKNNMKKLICLLCVLLVCGCSPGKDKTEYDVANKTYYNEIDEYGNNDHSKAWFGKDGSFVMTDNFFDGYYEIVGKWSINENVCTVEVENSGVGDFKKIIFEIQDDETIVLKTTLAGSKSDDVFSTTEIKGGDSGNSGNSQPYEKIIKTVENGYIIFYNSSQKDSNQSILQLIGLEDIAFVDRNDFGISEYDGIFKEEDGYLVLVSTVPECPFPASMVGERLFKIVDRNTLILEKDFGISVTGDVFVPTPNTPDADTWLFKHEPSDMCSDQYLPTIEFYAGVKDSFTFTENLFAGMGNFYGWYEETSNGYICHVEDASEIQGFMGADVKVIEFEKKDSNTLILKTDICMSMAGDKFILVP